MSSRSLLNEEQSNVASQVTEEDLEHLYQLVEVKDGGPTWMHMMDRSTSTMSYKAWRRDPKVDFFYLIQTVIQFSPTAVSGLEVQFGWNFSNFLSYNRIYFECMPSC